MDRRLGLAVAAGLVSVLAGVWWGRGVDTPPAQSITTSTSPEVSEASPSTIAVHVSGWVSEPGVVGLSEQARVGDAIAAAGGVRPGAALEQINLAQVLADGQQIVVPGPGGIGPTESAGGGQPGLGEGPIRLNSASATELEALPGVGPVLAGRIVDHRERHGGFDQVEDLLEVSGIGEATLASLRDLVAVP